MFSKKTDGAIAATLLLAIILWGGTNTGTKYLVHSWPPIFTGCTRLGGAGLLLLAILKWTRWMGSSHPHSPGISRALWFRGGLGLAVYIVVFNSALQLVPVSHVALYLGTAPVWALLWEERPALTWRSAKRYGAAILAVSGVVILSWPSLALGTSRLAGEFLGLLASLAWTNYGRQCRALGSELSGVEVSAHTMARAAALLVPFVVWEAFTKGIVWRGELVRVQLYCMVAGGVFAYVLWNNALRHWPASKVFLFNNLIPVSTMIWAWACLGEPVTATFWIALSFIATGVVLGQSKWEKLLGNRWAPAD